MASTSARTRRALAEAARFDPESVEPVVVRASGEEIEKIHLFTLIGDDGEEQQFFIPKKVKFNITLKATELYAQQGELAATTFILRSVLGDEGYEALINFEDLEQEDFERITEIASNIVLGAKEKAGKAR